MLPVEFIDQTAPIGNKLFQKIKQMNGALIMLQPLRYSILTSQPLQYNFQHAGLFGLFFIHMNFFVY